MGKKGLSDPAGITEARFRLAPRTILAKKDEIIPYPLFLSPPSKGILELGEKPAVEGKEVGLKDRLQPWIPNGPPLVHNE